MTQMMELDRDIKTVIRTLFYIFKKPETLSK